MLRRVDRALLIGPDIDEKNLEYAKRNVKLNSLQDRIMLYASTSSGSLIPLDAMRLDQYVSYHKSINQC